MIRIAPGDPIYVMLGRQPVTMEDIERYRRLLGLDQPIYIQYLLYLQRMAVGDWGRSIASKEPVLPLLLDKFVATIKLAVFTVAFASVIGILIGLICVMKRGSIIDSLFRITSSIGFSMPTFWLGLVLMYIFALWLRLLPAIGGGGIEHLILPALTLAIWASGWTARVTRASMLEILNSDHVVAAKAKGLPQSLIIYRHVFRNALIPVYTTIGLQLGSLLGGAFITETVFSYPGLGWLIITHIFMRDYPVVQGGILLAGTAFCLVNLVVDILYAFVDPRVRYEKERE